MKNLSRIRWLICLGALAAGCIADDQLVEEAEVAQAAGGSGSGGTTPPPAPAPLYTIRIHAIATADNNGANMSPVTAANVAAKLPALNAIFAPNRIQFLFDPATDFETRNSTLLNQRLGVVGNLADYTDPNVPPPTTTEQYMAARVAAADEHRDKVTIFFAAPLALQYQAATGRWALLPEGGGGSSGQFGRFVSWRQNFQPEDLAHELGHYLHMVHPFVEGVPTVAKAAERIQNYLAEGHLLSDGLRALDADRAWVLDTPADAMGSIFVDVHGDKCGPNGTISIPVTYQGKPETFTLEPDRSLVMSYFKDCPFEDRFSPNQITRQHDALRLLNRRSVVQFVSPSTTPVLDARGSASAGAISQVQIARIGEDRVVTATTGATTLKLIVWDVHNSSPLLDGLISRRGEIVVGDVSGPFAITHGGLDQVVVAYRDTSGGLTLKSYSVTEAGDPVLRDTATAGGITDVAIARIDPITILTPVRLPDGTLRTISWRIYADGTFNRTAHADGGTIASIEAVTPYQPGEEAGKAMIGAATTFARSEAGNLVVQTWKVSTTGSTWNIAVADSDGAGAITSTAATDVDFDLSASVVQTGTDVQKVIAWRTDYTGEITRTGSYTAGPCTRVASAAIGVSYLATACRRPGDDAQVIRLFELGPNGATVALRHEQEAGIASEVAMAPVGHNKVITAARSTGGALILRTFALAAP